MTDLRTLSKGLERLNQMFALILNCLLLYLVKNYTRKMGNFKIFINISAVLNVYLCFLLAVLNPQYFTINTSWGYFAQSFVESRYFTPIFCASYSLPFSFIVIHILYRYWTITKPERRLWFKRAWFLSVLALFAAVDTSFCYSRNILFTPAQATPASDAAHDYFRQRYNVTVEEGFIVVDYWPDNRLNLLSLFFLLSVVSRFLLELIFCVILARRTRQGIAASSSISKGHRTMQLKFLQTIAAQMAVPTFSVYIPLLIMLLSPLLGTSSSALASLFPFFASCYPLWDAAAVILLIRDYREGVYTMMTGKTVRNEISGFSTRGTAAFTSSRTRSSALPKAKQTSSSNFGSL